MLFRRRCTRGAVATAAGDGIRGSQTRRRRRRRRDLDNINNNNNQPISSQLMDCLVVRACVFGRDRAGNFLCRDRANCFLKDPGLTCAASHQVLCSFLANGKQASGNFSATPILKSPQPVHGLDIAVNVIWGRLQQPHVCVILCFLHRRRPGR